MDMQEYLRMLRRGWLTIVVATLVGLMLAAAYVVTAPRQYEASTALYVSANAPRTVEDVERGSNFSRTAVVSYAEIIDSATVLGPVANELGGRSTVDQLSTAVSATVPEDATLITIVASAPDAGGAATLADAVAASAVRVLPTLEADSRGVPLVAVEQTRTATEPTTAVSPNVRRTIALGLVVGLAAGMALTIVRQTLDTRIRRRESIEAASSPPLLAEIPAAKGRDASLVARDAPTSAAGEAYRTLRTNLGFIDSWAHRSLLVASVDDERGAEIALNIAWVLAQAGRTVVLVDADMRLGFVARAFGTPQAVGLAQVLEGQASLDSAMQQPLPVALSVVASGSTAASPPDLLSTTAMTDTIRRLERDFQHVVISGPCVLSSADSAIVAGMVGGTVLSVTAGRTRRVQLQSALTALSIVRVRPAGLVLFGSRGKRLRSAGPTRVPQQGQAPARPAQERSPGLEGTPQPERPSPRPRHGMTDGSATTVVLRQSP